MASDVASSVSLSSRQSIPPLSPDSDSPSCRICHESRDDDPTRPLFHPCHCKGSLSFVHQDCLVTWLSLKPHSAHTHHGHNHHHGGNSAPTPRCEVCNHPFTFDDDWKPAAPATASLTDLLADVASSVWSVIQLLAAIASIRQVIVLACVPLCPHLWRQLAASVTSLLAGGGGALGVVWGVVGVAWMVLRTVAILTVCSMLFSVVVITVLHYCLLWWNHEVHLLLFRLKGQLERLRLRRRREAVIADGNDNANGGNDARDAGDMGNAEQAANMAGVELAGGDGGGGGGAGDADEGEDEWLMWWSAGIHALVDVQSVGELLEWAYSYHLLLSLVFLVLPYSLTAATLSSTAITLTALSKISGLEWLHSLVLSSFALSKWVVSVHNGGLPLLLPEWVLSAASFTYPGTYFSSSFIFPSYLLHFTPPSLRYLHALLHISPLLHLLLFYTTAALLLLILRPRHPIHVILLSILSAAKVLIFVVVENFAFPAAMGVVVHLSFVPLLLESEAFDSLVELKSAGMKMVLSHLVTALSSPLSALFSHWMYGLCFLITMTSTFNLLIKVTKRRVIALLLPSVRRRHDLFHEVISQRTTRLARKVVRSFTLYSSLCLSLVGVTGMVVRAVGRLPVVRLLVDSVLPLRVEIYHPLHLVFHCLIVALFFYFVWLGSTSVRRSRRHTNKHRLRAIVTRIAHLTGLTDYAIKPASEVDREKGERLERRRIMRERRRREAEEDAAAEAENGDGGGVVGDVEVEVEGRVDSDDDTEDEIDRWMEETEMDHLIFEADMHQHHMQHAHGGGGGGGDDNADHPAADDDDELPELLDEDDAAAAEPPAEAAADDDTDSDEDDVMEEVDPALLAHLDLQHMQPAIANTLARKQRDAQEILLERQERSIIPHFYLRITAALTLLSATFSTRMLWLGLTSVGIGRLVLWVVPLHFLHLNDVLAAVVGYTILSHLRLTQITLTTNQLSEMRDWFIQLRWLTVLKFVLLVSYFLILFPLCLGILTQLTLLLPFRLTLNQRPIFHLHQEWTIGAVIVLFGAMSMYLHHSITTHTHFDHHHAAGPPPPLPPPPPTPLTFFSPFSTWYAHVVCVCQHGLAQCRLLSLIYDVLLPPSHFFVLHLALPYVITKGLLPFRLLLPWPLRADELLLLSALASGGGESGGEGSAYTSRLLESGVERWVYVVCIGVRVGVWSVSVLSGWYSEYKAIAFERRYTTRTLRNVDEDEEAEDEAKGEDEDEEEEEEAGEEDSEESTDGDDDSHDESDSDSDSEDERKESDERSEARRQRREALTQRRQSSATIATVAAVSRATSAEEKAVSSAERMLYWTYSVGSGSIEQHTASENANDQQDR